MNLDETDETDDADEAGVIGLGLEPVDTEGVKKSLADICYALQYLRYHHETFNIDPDRVAIFGNSSGASAAMLLGTVDDMARPNSDDPIRRECTRISGFAALEPQASLDIAHYTAAYRRSLRSAGFHRESGRDRFSTRRTTGTPRR